jgi:hypothetical protein
MRKSLKSKGANYILRKLRRQGVVPQTVTMKPPKPEKNNQQDLFRQRLDSIINMRHELVLLSYGIDWDRLDNDNLYLHPRILLCSYSYNISSSLDT